MSYICKYIKNNKLFSVYNLKEDQKSSPFLFLLFTGSKVNDMPTPQLTALQAVLLEVKELQTMHAQAIKVQEETQQALEKELTSHQELKLQLEKNKTSSDNLQRQLERLHLERATLLADSVDMREWSLRQLFLQRSSD